MSRVANLVKEALFRGDFTNCFTKPVSALACAEPIVVLEGAFARTSRIDGEERGAVSVTVLVVREDAEAAEGVAVACEQLLRGCDWERDAAAWPYRVVGLDSTAPRFKERDGSGRFVWEFSVELTVARSA